MASSTTATTVVQGGTFNSQQLMGLIHEEWPKAVDIVTQWDWDQASGAIKKSRFPLARKTRAALLTRRYDQSRRQTRYLHCTEEGELRYELERFYRLDQLTPEQLGWVLEDVRAFVALRPTSTLWLEKL